jgi:glutaredoxin-like YruB-family protein
MVEKNKKVVVYTTPTCEYCKMTKDYFRRHHIDFTEVDVSGDEEAAEKMVAKTGHLGVPQIFIGNDVVIGFDRIMLDKLLHL